MYAFSISKDSNAFTATIKKISEYNGITSVLAEAEDENDLNLSGEFDFTIDADTSLIRKGKEMQISDLEVGQKSFNYGKGRDFRTGSCPSDRSYESK